MTYYDIEARKRLGRVVNRARRAAGYADTEEWAALIGRSTRVALGLERGESAGRKTYTAVEEALHWHAGACYEILDGVDPAQAISPDVGGVTNTLPGYVSAPGEPSEGGASESEVLRAIAAMRQDMQDMESRLSERLDRLEGGA